MSGFLHYLHDTPMRDYPWWGWILTILFFVGLTVGMAFLDAKYLRWVRGRR